MPYPHTIRLRGPWQFEPLVRYALTADGTIESLDDVPPPGRVTVPCDWGDSLGHDFRGRVRYRRSFNPPGSLDAHERVWLVVTGADARGDVSLNATRLGEVRGYAIGASFDITALVAARNEITLDVELPAHGGSEDEPLRPGRETLPGGPIGDVYLEIRSQQFIERLAVWNEAAHDHHYFIAAGRIAGEADDGPFAVVVSGCQRELAYIEASSGASFECPFEAEGFPNWTTDRPTLAPMEIKLLAGGSSVWQRQIQTGFRDVAANDEMPRLVQILADGAYADFDRAGTAVIQQMPLGWADDACAHLAHHPSIVAWSVLPGEPPPGTPTYGRPWRTG